jgi:hypothetical protein
MADYPGSGATRLPWHRHSLWEIAPFAAPKFYPVHTEHNSTFVFQVRLVWWRRMCLLDRLTTPAATNPVRRVNQKGTGGPISGVRIGAAAPIAIAIEFPPGFLNGLALIFQLPVIQIFPDGSIWPPVIRINALL